MVRGKLKETIQFNYSHYIFFYSFKGVFHVICILNAIKSFVSPICPVLPLILPTLKKKNHVSWRTGKQLNKYWGNQLCPELWGLEHLLSCANITMANIHSFITSFQLCLKNCFNSKMLTIQSWKSNRLQLFFWIQE